MLQAVNIETIMKICTQGDVSWLNLILSKQK